MCYCLQLWVLTALESPREALRSSSHSFVGEIHISCGEVTQKVKSKTDSSLEL